MRDRVGRHRRREAVGRSTQLREQTAERAPALVRFGNQAIVGEADPARSRAGRHPDGNRLSAEADDLRRDRGRSGGREHDVQRLGKRIRRQFREAAGDRHLIARERVGRLHRVDGVPVRRKMQGRRRPHRIERRFDSAGEQLLQAQPAAAGQRIEREAGEEETVLREAPRLGQHHQLHHFAQRRAPMAVRLHLPEHLRRRRGEREPVHRVEKHAGERLGGRDADRGNPDEDEHAQIDDPGLVGGDLRRLRAFEQTLGLLDQRRPRRGEIQEVAEPVGGQHVLSQRARRLGGEDLEQPERPEQRVARRAHLRIRRDERVQPLHQARPGALSQDREGVVVCTHGWGAASAPVGS